MYFPATLTPYADGSGKYGVTFVDLPGCVTIGDNLEDALHMGAEALSLHVGAILADGHEPPPPSTLEDAAAMERHAAERDNLPVARGTIYQFISFEPAMKSSEAQVVRVTISLKPAALNLIDSAAMELGLSRSGFITVATREYCSRLGV